MAEFLQHTSFMMKRGYTVAVKFEDDLKLSEWIKRHFASLDDYLEH